MNRRRFMTGLACAAAAAPLIRANAREDGVSLMSIPHPHLTDDSEPRYEHKTYGLAYYVDEEGVYHEGYPSEEVGRRMHAALSHSMRLVR